MCAFPDTYCSTRGVSIMNKLKDWFNEDTLKEWLFALIMIIVFVTVFVGIVYIGML